MTLFCPECRLRQPTSHRFCPRCGTTLPVHLVDGTPKKVRWFPGIQVSPDDPADAYLRVSCYREDQIFEAPEGSVTIPGHHVRFSIWIDDRAHCALSIPATEALDLAGFVRRELSALEGDRTLEDR